MWPPSHLPPLGSLHPCLCCGDWAGTHITDYLAVQVYDLGDFLPHGVCPGYPVCVGRRQLLQRRAQRRQRAAARRACFLHRRGWVRLKPWRLHQILVTLKPQHSKDPSFLQRIQRAMTTSGQNGRFCGTCRKMRSPQAYFCDLCGQAWEDCIAPTNSQHNHTQSSQSQASSCKETQANQRTKSPRQRTRQRSGKKYPKRCWSMVLSMVCAFNAYGSQRLWERAPAIPHADGVTATASAANVADSAGPSWCALVTASSNGNAFHALHATAHGFVYYNGVATSYCDDCSCRGRRKQR